MPATATDSRETLLASAERLFAARGFAATTVKDIAGDAELNSALLYYYFADKEALYAAVLERAIGELGQQLRQVLEGSGSRSDALLGVVRAQAKLMTRRPTLPALLVREMLDSEGAHARVQLARLMGANFRQLCELIRSGQQSGEFRSDLSAELAAISTIAQLVYFFIARPGLQALSESPEDPRSLPTVDEFAEHAAAFALAALRERPAPERS